MTLASTPQDLSSNGLGGAIATPTAKPDSTGHALPREVHNVLSDIEHLIEQTTSITGDDLVRAKARLGERIVEARHALSEAGSAIAQATRRNADVVHRLAHERPWTMIGIGIALGGLFGFLLARSR